MRKLFPFHLSYNNTGFDKKKKKSHFNIIMS